MISDRDLNIDQRRFVKPGDLLVTQMPGKPAEVALVADVVGATVGLVNLNQGKPFSASLKNISRGRVGRSEIVGEEKKPVGETKSSGGSETDATSVLGTDMVVVKSKGSDEEILTVVTGIDDGSVVLSSPEKRDTQMLRIPEEELRNGKSGDLTFEPVDRKFSLLKDSAMLEETAEKIRKERICAEKPVYVHSGGIKSRDVESANIIGGMLPDRTAEERRRNPDGVFQEAIALAARKMLKNGEKRALAAALALSMGTLSRLPLLEK